MQMNDQQKIELGKTIMKRVCSSDDFDHSYLIELSEFTLNKIQELTQNHENNEPEHKNAPSDNTEVGQYQTTGEKHHVCGCCYQSYPAKYLERNFITCNPCKDTGKERPTCLDKNGKLFTSGDWLKNEKSSAMVQVIAILPMYIVANGRHIDRQDFIDAGWIVHERVTKIVDDHSEFCEFTPWKIGSVACIHHCDESKGFDLDQQWVICKLYNREVEG